MAETEDEVRIPFDPDTESMYCSMDGLKLEKSGHMFSEFMLCPRHGEFTIAPVIMRKSTNVMSEHPNTGKLEFLDDPSVDAGKWFIHVDRQMASMIETCRAVDKRHEDGSDYDPRETRVL